MCTGIEMVALASALFGTVSAVTQKTPEPPKAETPAIAAPTSRAPGATVRLGNNSNDITNGDTNDPSKDKFTEKRAAGNALGNLGKSGLAI